MLKKDIFRVVVYGLGIGSISSVIWLAGPLIAIGDYHPLESYIVREIVILLIISAAGSLGGFNIFKRLKSSKQLAQGITSASETGPADDSSVLKDRMKDALVTLKTASGGKGDALYDLPWYVLIGPPGSGKTTALVHSGLKFPLARGATPAAIAGVGGTRYCDWWFTEDAVLIDTAGRYTTQDSDARSDQQSWLSFLDLMKKNRPRQPINGVIVAISLEDLMTLKPEEIAAHGNAIRARLLELHDRLKIAFPVYALFTKADLVAGFMEFFGILGENARRQVWGATFQTDDKNKNLVGEVPKEFDSLLERLNDELTDRLQEEPVPSSRVALFGFPSQMAALKRPIHNFLNLIFEPTRYHANATLRGFYFSSGTQEGTPIDQVIGALARSFGAQEIGSTSYSGRGKSFFLTDLINKVIIGEAAWVSSDRSAVRRNLLLKAASLTAVALVAAVMAGAWWISYLRNSSLISQTDDSVKQYQTAAARLIGQTKVGDRDLGEAARVLHRLRYLPTGYGTRTTSTPLASTFGLSQRERLQSSAENAYHQALERMFRPRLLYRLEEQLDATKSNGGQAYETLKVYLMLGKQHKIDRELVMSWMRRDWEQNLYPGVGNEGGRKSLEEHLSAMLDLDNGEDLPYGLHGPLVDEVRKTLVRMSVAEQAYEVLKSQSRSASGTDWIASAKGGLDFPTVFQARGGTVESIRVPYFFTYAGFQNAFIARLGDIAEQLQRDRWVLGESGGQNAIDVQYQRLGPDLLQLYTKDFVTAWNAALNKLEIKPLMADKPRYQVLGALVSPTSPLTQLLESIRNETALTRQRTAPANAQGGNAKPAEAKPLPTLLTQSGNAPGTEIEQAFRASHLLLEGSPRPIDKVLSTLAEIRRNLTLLATEQTMGAQATAQLKIEVSNLRNSANVLPPPWQDLMNRAVRQFEGEVTTSSRVELQRALGEVTGACQTIISGRYPFFRSDREVPMVEFGRLFGGGGVFDKFFQQYLAPLVDQSQRTWHWRADNPLARELPPATLAEFQRAAQIRDAFFSTGGNMPMVMMTVIPPPANPQGGAARLEINGSVIESRGPGSSPVQVMWPGAGVNRSAVTVGGDLIGQAAVVDKQGAWSLFRLIEGASLRGDRVVANFYVGGRDLQYQFLASTINHPLNLPALREFRCPTAL